MVLILNKKNQDNMILSESIALLIKSKEKKPFGMISHDR